ncbi:pyridoxamine 5'-phosphate oxidase family protein [Herbiconiux moechotypicola]|uniref:Pyridoxamine 5'-phosphate oxidase n=1 Tax=Herbiconiux moechotypicola TaxID=637393 RepID=A0ABN3E5J0_9MICO|nr:pyridoxamine 5'-phosphate oxidase family protein [Herbiconiux moechotypicola]MCS5731915.1 pyridoxamine 5'-phosphate oxidase family protein [Herbiconiux moechotypicola]
MSGEATDTPRPGAAGVFADTTAAPVVTRSPSAEAASTGMAPDPFALLADWLPANDDPARPLMTLSTVASSGYPDARTVLLSEFGPEGLYFHTDSRSRKVLDVTATPRAALTMVWPGRQLVVQGDVSRASAEEQTAAYGRRSRYLQMLAWLNTDDFAALPLEERLATWAAFGEQHPDGSLEAPGTWAGFVVSPVRITFWEGRPDTAGIRTEFTRASGAGDSWGCGVIAG